MSKEKGRSGREGLAPRKKKVGAVGLHGNMGIEMCKPFTFHLHVGMEVGVIFRQWEGMGIVVALVAEFAKMYSEFEWRTLMDKTVRI